MSAWIVTKHHLDAMITAALFNTASDRFRWFHDGTWHELTTANANEVGTMLWAENHRSVNHRYSENDEPQPYRFRHYSGPVNLTPGAVACIVACYDYQTCEHDAWEASSAWAFCRALERKVLRQLPDYEKCPWGINDPAQHVPKLV